MASTKNYRARGVGPWTNADGGKVASTAGQIVALTDAEYNANSSVFEPARNEDQTPPAKPNPNQAEMDRTEADRRTKAGMTAETAAERTERVRQGR